MQIMPPGFQEILRVEVGSTVHGCNVDDQDDLDCMGVCIETPEFVTGLEHFEQHQYRDAWQRTHTSAGSQPQPRSMPGDLDLVVYSLRKWCRLALTGNPSALLLVYSPKVLIDTLLGRELKKIRGAFRSKRVGAAYLGYMHEQRARLEGRRGQKGVIRAELIEKYGYDTKYAYHILRLGIQGNEYCATGGLTLPMRPSDRDYLLGVRTGEVTFIEAMEQAKFYEDQLRKRLESNKIPDEPDRARVNQFLMDAYRYAWNLHESVLQSGWGIDPQKF
jgi:predicted nucleotidyltransferase